MINIEWFEKNITPKLKEYNVIHQYFKEGDFGSLNQFEFNKNEKGGEVEIWNSGCVRIHFVDFEKGEELLNVFCEPIEMSKILNSFNLLLKIL